MNPIYGEKSFICPNCSVHAQQFWQEVVTGSRSIYIDDEREWEDVEYYDLQSGLRSTQNQEEMYFRTDNLVSFSKCNSCDEICVWVDGNLVHPLKHSIEDPKELMPQEVKSLYNEARDVFTYSPRASVALLRLALEELLPFLGTEKAKINVMISDLSRKGKLKEEVKNAMDVLRIIGNNAVHGGVIELSNLEEDPQRTAKALFKLLNYIVVETLQSNALIKEFYSLLPEQSLEGINLRDSKKR